MRRNICLLSAASVLAGWAPSIATATDLACRPGVTVKIFARESLWLPKGGARQLVGDLDGYAQATKLPHSGDSSFYDLMSPKIGTHIIIRSSAASRRAAVEVSNDCTAAPEDWRPHWAAFNSFIARRYGRASIVPGRRLPLP